MPKELFLDPDQLRKTGTIKFHDIALNSYQKKIADVKGEFSKEELDGIFFDMRMIRELEAMIYGIRGSKFYNGIEYQYTGPAHLYTGQESAAVGEAFVLDVEDFTFGNHRSHGEVIAKGFSAIRKLEENQLYEIMKNFHGGKLLSNVEKFSKNRDSVRQLAMDFLLYGFMTELFGREIGFTGGLGNSMHVFFTPFGIYPNNAIVGGGPGIGAGAALYKKLAGKDGIVVVNAGDGSLGTGAAYEAINFSIMDQYTTLWDDAYKGGLPIIFNFMNNGYAMSGQTSGETAGYRFLARVGAGYNEAQLHAERIDGLNPFAVIDAFRRKKEIVLRHEGPVLLDTLVYRHGGHSVTDQYAYRTKEEMDKWMEQDCIALYKQDLLDNKISSKDEIEAVEEGIKERITEICRKATDLEFSPRMDFFKEPDAVSKCMFSNGHAEKMDDREPEVIGKKEENSRYRKILQKERFGLDASGKALSPLKTYTCRDAVFEALLDKFYMDPSMVMFGEDIREHGNSFGVLTGLYESVPRHRLFNTPIAEGSIISAAVGYGLAGGRAVPEIMWCDFLGRCADELLNQLAKWQGMSAGILKMPVCVRVSIGAFYGAQHSQDWSGLCTCVPGLKVLYPATPYDIKGLLNAALCSTDPCMFFESQKTYDKPELFHEGGVPKEYYEIEIGRADVKRSGTDLTILTIGPVLYEGIAAAVELKEKYGVSAEVIDARTLVPFDYETLIESVKKTGKLLIVSDACERGSYTKTIAENMGEFVFNYLDAPVCTIGSHNWVSPCPELEKFFFPQKDLIIDTVNEKIMRLPGHLPKYNVTNAEKLRCEKLGI